MKDSDVVVCECCASTLPMAAAYSTEDPVWLCARCAADAVGHSIRAERDEVGVQLAALWDRHKKLERVVKLCRRALAERVWVVGSRQDEACRALAALDEVPGDEGVPGNDKQGGG